MAKDKSRKDKYLSMKWGIILLILPTVLITTIAVLGMIYFTSKNALIEKEVVMIQKESDTGAAVIGQWTNEILQKVNMVADLVQEDRLGSQRNVSTYVTDHQDLIDGCEEGFYIVYSNGATIQAGSDIGANPSYVGEDWYQFCLNNAEAAFDECSYYEEEGSSGYSVTVGRQLTDKVGGVTGIIAIDAYLDGINSQVASNKGAIEGDILVIDKKSNMIIAGTKDGLSGIHMNEATDSFVQAIQGDVTAGTLQNTYHTTGNNYYTAGSMIDGTDWMYVVYVDQNIALASLHTVRNIAMIGLLVLVIMITLVCVIGIGYEMKKLTVVEGRISRITEGSFILDEQQKESKIKNEIVSIHENLNAFIQKMIQMIKIILLASQNLSQHAAVFSDMAQELEEDATTESMAVNDLTSTIGEMTGAVQSLAENASELAGIVQNTQTSGVEAGHKMQEVVGIVEKSNQDITNVSIEMKKVEVSMEDLEELVVEVSEAAEKINSITGVIKSIAEETNLLSLNASIEAARAGEHGRGFAVVAEEIKSLAATSEENAGAIEKLIMNISSLIKRTSEATKSNVTGMQISFDKLEETTTSFHQITEVVKETNEQLNQLVQDITQVDQIATDIAAISQEQAASSEEILATTQTVNENVERTKERSEKIKEGTAVLSIAAKDLENEMKFFQI